MTENFDTFPNPEGFANDFSEAPDFEPGFAPDAEPSFGSSDDRDRGFGPDFRGGRERGFGPEFQGGRDWGFGPEFRGSRERGFGPEFQGGRDWGFGPEFRGSRERGFGRGHHHGHGGGRDFGFGGFPGGFGAFMMGFGPGGAGFGFGPGGGGGGFGRGGWGFGPGGRDFGDGGRGDGPGGPGDERRGRGRRPFDHGRIRIVILSLIAEKPRHGYDIIKTIEERFGGSYSPSPGVVYPTLTMLEEMGYTTVEENGGKKLYTITPEGEAYLKVHHPDHATEEPRPQRQGPSPELMRAMGNLRIAIRSRYHEGQPTDEQMAEIVKAIEQAAATIERL